MSKHLVIAFALVAAAVTLDAQDKKASVADFAGTWNIEFMSHQLALVIEPAEGNKSLPDLAPPAHARNVAEKILREISRAGEFAGHGMHMTPHGYRRDA